MASMKELVLGKHPVELHEALNRIFEGKPWLTYEPETVLLSITDEPLPEECKDKILAVQAVAANGNPACKNMLAFEKTVQAFNNNLPVMDATQPPHVEEICYAVPQIVGIIRKENEPGTPVYFSGEVPGYVAGVAKFRGWSVLPPILGFAEEMFGHITGIRPGSERYEENRQLLDLVRELQAKIGKDDVELLLENDVVSRLSPREAEQVRKIIGCLVYDPTVLYKD